MSENLKGYIDVLDAQIAPWLTASSWGTGMDLFSSSIVDITVEVRHNEREGDGGVVTTATTRVKALLIEFEYQFTGIDQLSAIMNVTPTSGSVDRQMVIAKEYFGYFGYAGLIPNGDGTEFLEVFVPKLMITEDIKLTFNTDSITAQRIRAKAVYNDAIYGFGIMNERASEPTLSFPPAALN